ncbi:MAG: hypothetical protein DLM70_03680 [Chloroflexi bacterium]|nr:MAG: hypothetical protein DLM70_03680 [Chloroflexota bacterium]
MPVKLVRKTGTLLHGIFVRFTMRLRTTRLYLSAIVMFAVILCVRWVFLVPIDEAPDEPSHLDYAFAIYSAGHLLNARDNPITYGYASAYSTYLARQTMLHRIAFHPDAKVSGAYGSGGYYRALDRSAPRQTVRRGIVRAPQYLEVNPVGFYALLAGWIWLISHVTDSLVALFFAARLFSVLLLACSLILTYAIARELRFPSSRALLLTACVGFFPLTTFVSSYVQPDNLSLTAWSLCMYLALRIRRLANRRDQVGLTRAVSPSTRF